MTKRRTARRRTASCLGLMFATAMLMGPGPGLYLIAPDPAAPAPPATLLGLPIVYGWGVIWFGVQAAVLVATYVLFWRTGDAPAEED